MPDDVLGLPLHPLVIHAVVVLLPLAGLGALALAAVPRWRTTYGWLLLAVATAGTASVPVATRTGTQLRSDLQIGGTAAEVVDRHQMLGERVIWAALPFWVLLVAGVLLARRRSSGGSVTVVWLLAAVAGLATIALVVVTGHVGSEAVWSRG